jgi:membrane fusion protein (multidrug efflux system)
MLSSSGCGPEDVAEAEANVNPEPPPVNVSVVKLKPETLKDEVKLAGRLEPWVEVQVSTELGGTVQEIGFDKGRRVKQGQVLARIGTDLLEASLAETEAALEHAESEFNKVTELFNRQAVPRQDLTSATSNYHGAQARVEQARLRVERSIVRAPVAGMAISREIEPGEFLPAGTLVTTIHQVSKLKAVVGIPENDIPYFHVGTEAHVEVDAYRDRSFTGTMHFLSPAATGQNRTFPAEVAIDNESGDLRPGMIVRVRLVKEVYEDLIVVPRDAVLERDTGYVAFVYEDGRAVLRNVETGPSEQGLIVVLDGLAPGENLIVTGHRNLVDGQPVRSVNDAL